MPKSRKGGVLLPTAPNVVANPVAAYDLKDLDERQYRGYVMFQKILEGGKSQRVLMTSDDAVVIYASSNDGNLGYIVSRVVANDRGTMTVSYSCACPEYLKNMRSGCKHTFCEKLRRKEATTFGDPPTREPRRSAQRRAPVKRLGRNGKSERSNQRATRVEMPTRVPDLIDSLRALEDRRLQEEDERLGVSRLGRKRGGQKTTESTRAATLLLKVSNGVSANAMVDRYRTYIDRGVLLLKEPPSQNTLTNWMSDAALEVVLRRMFLETVYLFRAMESVGIMDSTKLSNGETVRSLGVEYQRVERPCARWLKCHVIVGLESSAILAYEFSASTAHDSLYYKNLVNSAAEVFPLKYILADKAYLSEEIVGWSYKVHRIKAVIPIKKKWDAETKSKEYYEICRQLVDWHDNDRKRFDEIYRFRVKVEAVFSVLKRMFHGYNWSKGRRNKPFGGAEFSQAWRNETLCKLIAYNLRCAVTQENQTIHRASFGSRTNFFPEVDPADRRLYLAA